MKTVEMMGATKVKNALLAKEKKVSSGFWQETK